MALTPTQSDVEIGNVQQPTTRPQGNFTRINLLMQLFNGVMNVQTYMHNSGAKAILEDGLAHEQSGYVLINKKGVRWLSSLGVI